MSAEGNRWVHARVPPSEGLLQLPAGVVCRCVCGALLADIDQNLICIFNSDHPLSRTCAVTSVCLRGYARFCRLRRKKAASPVSDLIALMKLVSSVVNALVVCDWGMSQSQTIFFQFPWSYITLETVAMWFVSHAQIILPLTLSWINYIYFQVTVKNIRKQRENTWEFDKVGLQKELGWIL